MVDMQSATAEIRRGRKEEEKRKNKERKKKEKRNRKNIMSASATQGGHKNAHILCSKNVDTKLTAVNPSNLS